VSRPESLSLRGTLRLEESGVIIGPETRRPELLNALSPPPRLLVSNGPWRTYNLGTHSVEGVPFAIVASFHDDTLSLIALVHLVEGDDGGWDAQREDARKRFHDQWLGRPADSPQTVRYEWGYVDSGLDIHGGESAITVRYERR
jgi:hypothetical protein